MIFLILADRQDISKLSIRFMEEKAYHAKDVVASSKKL